MTAKPLLCLMAVLALLQFACGGGDAAPSDEDPAALLERSVEAVGEVTSFAFELDHENGGTPMALGLELTRAEGVVAVPDRLRASVNARAAPINVTVQVVAIGNRTWVTNPFDRSWQELPGATLQDIADPAGLMAALVANLQDVTLVGEIQVNGERGYRLAGTLDSGVLQVALPSAQAGRPVSVDLWLNAEDALPRRARLAGPLSDDEDEDIVREVRFTDFNAGVDIQPPVN